MSSRLAAHAGARRPPGRIKVIRIIARLNIGGPAIHAILLTSRLDRERYETLLVKGSEGRDEGDMGDLAREHDVTPVWIPELGREIRWWDDVVAFWKIYAIVRRERPSIVHTHTAKAGLVGRLAAWLAGVPVVLHTFHGHVFHGYFSPAKTRLFLGIERWLARRTRRVLAVSEAVRRELLTLGIGSAERLAVMPLGLALEPFLCCEPLRGQLRGELGIGATVPLVGIVARLVPVKAHEVFLEAAATVARRLPQARFVVVGDGERRSELESLADRLGLGERARFLGWRRDLDRIYADLDLVALSSRNEGSPVSLIEAMAAARAVVATRVGGVPDLVEDGVTGRLVPPGDPAALAGTMLTLLADPERRRDMGLAGRKRVYPAFSVERLVGDMDRLYTDLLAEVRS
ncbi:MAG: glycosyltransferase family 4 protein [Candidatus Rokubacteria bacterium]|nr:glycosyltransferase family 4 protein [Candidatus Rokubacteria bacterium]